MRKVQQSKRITPLQQSRFLKSIVILVVIAVIWLLFSPNGGLIDFLNKRKQVIRLTEETAQLAAENVKLGNDIARIHEDRQLLEQIAREQHGLLRENEKVFDFSKTKTGKKDE